MTALFNRYLFNNRTIPSINGFTNMSRRPFANMPGFNTWVHVWSRAYNGVTIGCEIYVCDSVFSRKSYSGLPYDTSTILRCSLWLNSENKNDSVTNFKICSSYGNRLVNPEASFEEFKNITTEMTEVIRKHL